jgi:predicted enzyme related to lactoylglutathione lyase
MHRLHPRLAGIELYFDDLPRAKSFYADVLGLDLAEEQAGHHARFATGTVFVCLEKRGLEDYPSADKVVLFLEVPDLARALEGIGSERVVRAELNPPTPWAVLHDPEGHNILLLQASRDSAP